MKIDRFIKAALLGLSLGVGTAPVAGLAETLRVTDTGPSRALKVPMNRAVVVESDNPFAELPSQTQVSQTFRPCLTAPSMCWARHPDAPH